MTTMRLLASGLVRRKSTSAPTCRVVRREPLDTSKEVTDAPTLLGGQLRRDGDPAGFPERARGGLRSLPPGDLHGREQIETQDLEVDLVSSGQGDVEAVERPGPRDARVGQDPRVERLGNRRCPSQDREVGISADRTHASREGSECIAVDDLDGENRRDTQGYAEHAQEEERPAGSEVCSQRFEEVSDHVFSRTPL